MAPISNASISDMTNRVKDAFSTPESTLRTIEDGKDPVKVIEIINDPAKSLVVSESQVTKGSVMEALNNEADLSLKSLVEADKKGETTTVPAWEFPTENPNQQLKIEA